MGVSWLLQAAVVGLSAGRKGGRISLFGCAAPTLVTESLDGLISIKHTGGDSLCSIVSL